MNTQCDMDRRDLRTTPQGAAHAPQPLSAVGLMLGLIGASGTPASAQLMTKPQVANLIKTVVHGVDEFSNYLEKRATTRATPPRSMREDILGALAGHQ